MGNESLDGQSSDAPVSLRCLHSPASMYHTPPLDIHRISVGPNVDATRHDLSCTSAEDSNSIEAPPKKHPSVHARQLLTNHNDTQSVLKFESPPLRSQPVDWKPSLVHLGPLAGLIALLLSFLQILASFAVLWGSHNQPTSSWTYQPTVYLAILTAISNKALAFAAVKGTIVTWWLKAIRGTSLKQLHNDWTFGLFTYKALAAGRNFNALALACILATIVAVDGPLLQRASSVKSKVPTKPVALSVTIVPEMPSYLSGVMSNLTDSNAFSPNFTRAVEAYAQNEPITAGIHGCPSSGTCAATIHAPALALESCESSLQYINYTETLSAQDLAIFEEDPGAPLRDRVSFNVLVTNTVGTRERLVVTTKISDGDVTRTCAGHINTTSCYFVSAIGEYDVSITNNTITLPGSVSPRIVALANNTALTSETITQYHLTSPESESQILSTLAGIAAAADLRFFSEVSFVDENGTMGIQTGGASWFSYQQMTNFEAIYNLRDCAPAWRDPRPVIMADINALMFRAGTYFARNLGPDGFPNRLLHPAIGDIDPGLDVLYNTTGYRTDAILVFQTDFRYFFAAAVIEIVSISTILWTFYGFWRLGRDTSFSPVEIAKSFDAPLLQNDESNLEASHLAKKHGDRALRYGRVDDDVIHGDAKTGFFTKEKLIFGAENQVRPVNNGTSRA